MNSSSSKAPAAASVQRQFRIPPVRVKRVLQSDENIGKMNNAVPIVLASLLEHFTERLLLKTEQAAAGCCLKTLNPSHIKLAAAQDPSLHFLLSLFDGSVDDDALLQANKSGRKRRRKSSFVDDDNSNVDSPS